MKMRQPTHVVILILLLGNVGTVCVEAQEFSDALQGAPAGGGPTY